MSDDGGQAGAEYAGRTVGGGRFQLQSLLGAGGMASVYLAYDSVLDRKVAVKTLHTELGREQSFRERFRREAQAVAKLTHTNIVSVFDSGEDELSGSGSGGGSGALVPYIVMEYVEGKPLRSVLDEDIAQFGAMPAEKALKITGDVLAALEVSHEMGLVHRDIKPGNVMITKRGVVKVMDFGIARAMQSGVTSMTQTGMVVGTPQYLSPEQALGRGVDARSDLYSVGIMLFELLTGRLPFDADSPLAIAYAHVQEEAPTPSAINQSLTPAVDALVARTLRKNPNERFPSAETMNQECARVSGQAAAAGASPSIVQGGPAVQSGAGVGQAVFPQVGEGGAPPPGMQPYQPQQQYGGFGPSTPPPPGTAPMGQYAPGAPAPYAAQPGAGQHTPPPYTLSPQQPPGGGGGRKSNTPVIIGSAVAVLVAITAMIIAFVVTNPDDKKKADDKPSATAAAPQAPEPSSEAEGSGGDSEDEGADGFKPEDKSKTIETTRCTDAPDSYSDRGKKIVPDFTYKNLASVKKCIKAAGWRLGEISHEDENIWGKNMVLEQSPDGIEYLDPKKDKIDLTVSTGKPAD
ncbi:serine/threonine protein kinase [Streptomyces sp. HNM0575]|uniref:protein kinase domain-containing protein n=1 Tax=Streptomyces sp. HNM0575 TaxID=2716338 RepID=UPI00145E2F84|nr:protein kinase [Streptomyces sp. HNM0575]NLU76016.1 serine/threonine protein kinase [Streptomyces sp. HNM0575]